MFTYLLFGFQYYKLKRRKAEDRGHQLPQSCDHLSNAYITVFVLCTLVGAH